MPFGSGSSLELTNVNGHVTVSTWGREEIRIEAEKFASSERRLDDVEIEIEETSGGVEVRTRLPKGGLFSGKGKVNYQITLPATAIVNVRTVNGKLVFTGEPFTVLASRRPPTHPQRLRRARAHRPLGKPKAVRPTRNRRRLLRDQDHQRFGPDREKSLRCRLAKTRPYKLDTRQRSASELLR